MRLPWRRQPPQNTRTRPVARPTSRSVAEDAGANWHYVAIVFGVVALVTAALASWWRLSDPATLPLKQVRIEGEFKHLTVNDIYTVLLPQARSGFFAVDVAGIATAVRTLPWVDTVAVQRVWPDTLRVLVTEQQPLARWQGGGLVNFRGERFVPAPETYPANLPLLFGPETNIGVVAQRYVVTAERLRAAGAHVASLGLTPRRAWEVVLDNGIVIMLGRQDTDLRVGRLARFYPALASRAGLVARFDMRYTNGFAVKWRGAPPTAKDLLLG